MDEIHGNGFVRMGTDLVTPAHYSDLNEEQNICVQEFGSFLHYAKLLGQSHKQLFRPIKKIANAEVVSRQSGEEQQQEDGAVPAGQRPVQASGGRP
ncbi:MAG: hypothetical protein ACREX4_22200 [Gammaproteobacteria bacterium]